MKLLAGEVVWPALLLTLCSQWLQPPDGAAKWPISGLLSAEYPMISVDLRVPAPPHVRATAGPRRATPPPRR